jgi:hypothetical protein
MKRTTLRTLTKNTRGAVLAEFALALMPLLSMFFGFVQLAKIATARLMLKHAAICAARAAAIYTNQHDNNPGEDKELNQAQVNGATLAALGDYYDRPGGFKAAWATVTDNSSKEDPYGWVNVRVIGVYSCSVPLGGLLACGFMREKIMVEDYRMPHQGALYNGDPADKRKNNSELFGGGKSGGGGGGGKY